MKARTDAELQLKHVTDVETAFLRKAVDSHKIIEENMT